MNAAVSWAAGLLPVDANLGASSVLRASGLPSTAFGSKGWYGPIR